MTCDEARELIQAELDRRTGPQDATSGTTHQDATSGTTYQDATSGTGLQDATRGTGFQPVNDVPPGAAESHLRECGPCRRWAEELREVGEGLRAALSVSGAPRTLSARVWAALEGPDGVRLGPPSGPPRRAWRWLAIPAAAALAIAVIVGLGLRRVPHAEPVGNPSIITGAESLHVFAPASTVAREATVGQVLLPGSTAWSLDGDSVRLGFENGGSVQFGHDAVVQFGAASMVLYRGAVDVSLPADQRLVVRTPVGDVEVLGGETAVTLPPGSPLAHIETRTGKAVVRNGRVIEVGPDDPPLLIGRPPTDEFLPRGTGLQPVSGGSGTL